MLRFTAFLLLASFMLAAPPAYAATCAGVTLAESADVDGKKLVLNGLGIRKVTMFAVKVYVAALYVETKSADGAAIAAGDVPRKLVLRVVRDVSKEQIAGSWTERFEKNANNHAAIADRITTLNGFMADVSSGDEIAFTYRPSAGLEVDVKGKARGVVAGADFAEAFFSIWLGGEPPNPELKSGLLGGACE